MVINNYGVQGHQLWGEFGWNVTNVGSLSKYSTCTMGCNPLLLGHLHYILWLTSPLICWNQVRTRKKTDNLDFFYFLLRHALKLLLKHVLLQVKNMLKIPKIN